MSEHGPPASDRGRPVLRWAAPTRGYVIAAAASVLITNGAGVVWQGLSLASGSGGGARGGGWLSVTAVVVLLLGMVAVVDRARRPRPWAPGARGTAGVGERARERQPRDGEERRALRRAVGRGVLPQRRRWQRIAAQRLADRVAAMTGFVWMGLLFAGLLFAMGSRGTFAPPESWAAALPGLSWTLLGIAAFGQDWWLCSRAALLMAALHAERGRAEAGCPQRLETAGEPGAGSPPPSGGPDAST